MKQITLTAFKAMSGAEILKSLADGGISVEIGGNHIFDVVSPLNELDDKFLALSRYVADQVSNEFDKKIKTLRVEEMFDPRNAKDVVKSAAARLPAAAAVYNDDKEDAPKQARATKTAKKKAPVKSTMKKASSSRAAKPTAPRTTMPKVVESLTAEPIEYDPFPDSTPDDRTLDRVLSDTIGAASELGEAPFPDNSTDEVREDAFFDGVAADLHEDPFPDNSPEETGLMNQDTALSGDAWEGDDQAPFGLGADKKSIEDQIAGEEETAALREDRLPEDSVFEQITAFENDVLAEDEAFPSDEDDDDESVSLVRRVARKRH